MPTITFSEQSVGTRDPTFKFSNNTVYTKGVIVGDTAQPASPVIAANTSYLGPVFVFFDAPVQSASVNVGYFDQLKSTLVEFYDATGKVLMSFESSKLGVQLFSYSNSAGIAAIAAIDKAIDKNGFSLDTIVFSDPANTLTPPTVSKAAGGAADRDLGAVGAKSVIVSDSVGGADASDLFTFTAPSGGTAKATVFLNDNPSKTLTFTLQIAAGSNSILVAPPTAYASAQGYTLKLDFTLSKSDNDAAIDKWLSDTQQKFLSGTLSLQETKFELLKLVQKNIGDSADAVRMLEKIEKSYGAFGIAFDLANRAHAVSTASDYKQELFAQVIDWTVGWAATGAVGGGLTLVGTPIVGVLGAAVTNLVYTFAISDQVIGISREWYAHPENFLSPAGLVLEGAQSAAAATAIDLAKVTFDSAYYLNTYADARAAVLSGAAASAYIHYIQIGAGLGYKPSASADPIPQNQIALWSPTANAARGYNGTVFTAAMGAFAGDGLSMTEAAFAAYLNDRRTDGTELGIDKTISALANRVARDWAVNHADSPQAAFNHANLEGWAAVLSNGKSVAAAFATLPQLPAGTNLANLKMVAIYTAETDATKVFQVFFSDPLGAARLLGTDYKSVGIGEFGGVWVLLFNTAASSQAAPTDTAPVSVQLFGSDDRDVLYAGGGVGLLTGGEGSDDLVGGASADGLDGGGGDDIIDGRAGADILTGAGGNDVLDGEAGVDTARYGGRVRDYAVTVESDGWRVADLRAQAPDGTDRLRNIESLAFSDRTIKLSDLNPAVAIAVGSILRSGFLEGPAGDLTTLLSSAVANGSLSGGAAVTQVIKQAGATSSVATLAYQFFTGKIPGQPGVDYLVSPTGPNANHLNSAYYQSFNLENRYINFAVNLGKVGEGNASFTAAYGALSLFDATKKAYAAIFGGTPTDAKVHALIDTRIDYFASYGGDGQSGIGTKAAMVGWLLAEAQKADVGVMARSNDAWMTDLADGVAPFAIDILDPAKGYWKSDFIFGA